MLLEWEVARRYSYSSEFELYDECLSLPAFQNALSTVLPIALLMQHFLNDLETISLGSDFHTNDTQLQTVESGGHCCWPAGVLRLSPIIHSL